jgi:hypothetical protein
MRSCGKLCACVCACIRLFVCMCICMSTCVRVYSNVRVCAVCQCVCVSPFICVCSRETVPKCTRVGCDVGRETRVTKWVKSDELCATGCSRDDPRLRHAADSLSRLASARVHDTGETVLWPAVCSRPNWNELCYLNAVGNRYLRRCNWTACLVTAVRVSIL